MSLTRRRVLRVLAPAIAVVLVLAGATVAILTLRPGERETTDPLAVTVPVALHIPQVPADMKVGVIVTLGAGTTEGAEWSRAAEGAVVAQRRLALGGTYVDLIVEDDSGSATGAARAVKSLTDQGVSAIIYASAGKHMEPGLVTAAESEMPVILPYAPSADRPGVWSLSPDETSVSKALSLALEGFGQPLHVDAGEPLPGSSSLDNRVVFEPGADSAEFAADIARRAGLDPYAGGAYAGGRNAEVAEPAVGAPVDVIVVSGPPVQQAEVVYALQTRGVSTPIVLTSAATSPLFDSTLTGLGGSSASDLRAVGACWGDLEALERSAHGRAMSAYLASIRQFASDDLATNLMGDAPFAETGLSAEVRSHDAVLAVVSAAASAGSTEPATLSAALGQLRLTAGDGIAGPELDFANPAASEVQVLHATSQQLGLRPGGTSLVWVAQPERP